MSSLECILHKFSFAKVDFSVAFLSPEASGERGGSGRVRLADVQQAAGEVAGAVARRRLGLDALDHEGRPGQGPAPPSCLRTPGW